MSEELPVVVAGLSHAYGERTALRDVRFDVRPGEVFGLLGPNGGGKTTLFRILSTAIHPSAGQARVFGHDCAGDPSAVRREIGVVFQSPSLDKKLTVRENLRHHGHLYGLRGPELRRRTQELLDRVGLADRASDRVEHLSGGLQRRVEVAKGLLPRPRLLLMDEPNTGLDPAARRDLWTYLAEARRRDELTVLVTTHLMDEAQECDRVAILDRGELVAIGSPRELTAALGPEVVSIEADDAAHLAAQIEAQFGVPVRLVEGTIRVEQERGHELIAQLFNAFPGGIRSATVRQPSLEDVFLARTGHWFWDEDRG